MYTAQDLVEGEIVDGVQDIQAEVISAFGTFENDFFFKNSFSDL